jgi:hypothetical protein
MVATIAISGSLAMPVPAHFGQRFLWQSDERPVDPRALLFTQ